MRRISTPHGISASIVQASLLGAFLFTQNIQASAPREILAPVEKIFMAEGFDDNDNVEVSLYGNFPDTCYRVGPTGFDVDHETKTVKIWAKAYDYSSPNTMCMDVLTPFLLKVSVGVLKEGVYKVELFGQDLTQDLHIAKSTSDSPDDHLYAPVSQVKIKPDFGGKYKASFSGTFPRLLTGCMILKETKHYMTKNKVLVILPIAEVIQDEAQCMRSSIDFKDSVSFDPFFQDVGLVHVRVSNGNSQTHLIQLED